MAGVNKVILIGNLGADPEIRNLPSGSIVATFNLATSESYMTKEGERVEQTEWHRIELWEGLAKIAEQYLSKGRQVYIEGKLKTESWQDNDGNKRFITKIRATNMTLLGGKSSAGMPSDSENPSTSSRKTNEPVDLPDETDDLPF
jgi:single-strand DNA-binding protein